MNSPMATSQELRDRFGGPFLRLHGVPIIVWIVVVVSLASWHGSQRGQFSGAGWVESPNWVISSSTDGVLASIPMNVLDPVEEGMVVAVLDDAVLRAELVTAEAELARIRVEVAVAAQRRAREAGAADADRLNFTLAEEDARLDYLEEVVQREIDQIEIERLRREQERVRSLFDRGLVAEAEDEDVELRLQSLEAARQERDVFLEAAKRHLSQASARLQQHDALLSEPDDAILLSSFNEEIVVQEARISEIEQRRRNLVLRAPADGQIAQVFRRSGETALAGEPILAITSDIGSRVLAYVDASAHDRIDAGTVARLQSVDRPGRAAEAQVVRVGATLEEVPPRLASNPFVKETALAVLISDLPSGVFLPGERLSVMLQGSRP